jgi:hypothetical protein
MAGTGARKSPVARDPLHRPGRRRGPTAARPGAGRGRGAAQGIPPGKARRDHRNYHHNRKSNPKSLKEVLESWQTTTVTSSDCNVRNLTFAPKWSRLPMRLFVFGAFKPRVRRLGIDLAGEVEAVGRDVKRFQVGNQVFGRPDPALGAHAEYICMPEDGVLAAKPANTTWEEAASIPLAGNTALYFIRDLGNVQAGQAVLIRCGLLWQEAKSQIRGRALQSRGFDCLRRAH